MRIPRTRVYLHPAWVMDDYRLYIVRDVESGKIELATGFSWEARMEGDAFGAAEGIGEASELVQKIMDAAWEKGFRPSGFTDIKNETAALRDHLGDLRQIAFHKLGIDK